MPRVKEKVTKKQVLLLLPEALVKDMHEMLFDDEKGRIPGGAISAYVESLIKKDLSRMQNISLEKLL